MQAGPDHAPQTVIEIAVNLDDATGELVGETIAALIDAGALDAWAVPIVMKKGRPGVTLSLLCRAADREAMARRLIARTGSFGVRYRTWDRLVLERRHETVETAFGPLPVKVGRLNGRDLTAKVEFEDARRAAQQCQVPTRRVLDSARAAIERQLDLAADAEEPGGGGGP